MKKKLNGILLSAGLGTRLRPYTNETPKPAIPFLSIPLAVYPLTLLENFEIQNLLVNTHHLPEKIHALFQKLNWPCKKLIFSDESKQILGSGGGIRHAIKNLIGHQHFLVANSDEVILPQHHHTIEDAIRFHEFHKGIATLLVIEHPEVGTKFGGAWVKGEDPNNTKVSQFSKTAIAGHKGYHFIGVMILSDRIQNYFFEDDSKEENILYDTLKNALAHNEEVHVHKIDAQWFETGNPTDFLNATEICLNAIEKQNSTHGTEAWVEYLQQIIRLNETTKPILEAAQPQLAARAQNIITKIKKA